MSTWQNTDEYEDIDDSASNGFGAASESNANAGLPSGVIDRLKAYAERVSQPLADITKQFVENIATEYGCTDPSSEDEDLLVDWAEQLVVETRRSSGGGNSRLQTWVGCFLGVADSPTLCAPISNCSRMTPNRPSAVVALVCTPTTMVFGN